jgi:hypothetical protein
MLKRLFIQAKSRVRNCREQILSVGGVLIPLWIFYLASVLVLSNNYVSSPSITFDVFTAVSVFPYVCVILLDAAGLPWLLVSEGACGHGLCSMSFIGLFVATLVPSLLALLAKELLIVVFVKKLNSR